MVDNRPVVGRRGPKLHHIKPESVRLMDMIRVHGKTYDVDTTKVGVVTKRTHVGRSTEYTTKEGVILFETHADGSMGDATKITLISRPVDSQPFPDQVEASPTLEGL